MNANPKKKLQCFEIGMVYEVLQSYLVNHISYKTFHYPPPAVVASPSQDTFIRAFQQPTTEFSYTQRKQKLKFQDENKSLENKRNVILGHFIHKILEHIFHQIILWKIFRPSWSITLSRCSMLPLSKSPLIIFPAMTSNCQLAMKDA